MSQDFGSYFDDDALFDRLTDGLTATDKQVVFIVGAPVATSNGAGVLEHFHFL